MRKPAIFDVRSVAMLATSNGQRSIGPDGEEHWLPARPTGYQSFFQRWRAAWLVFTGQADALVWPTS